ncbi:vWA domain-containing protein [Planosporangium sp. 12N6]|uniref:vWA domain-containing protein n=1 Tax=Planosporangium spinosum TaxID=3402278 RepID=UPI003CF584A6
MPHPSSHLHAGTPTTGTTDPAWDEWSRAWTRHIPTLTGRSDLTVTVAPGAGGGAPACFYPDTGRIEVDAVHIGAPTVADPRRAGHKNLAPTAYGLLVHEAAHATHSRWRTPAGTPPVVAEVADLLEESRIEHRHRTRRRGDRRWLRHTVTTLITGDETPVDDPWHAGQLAGLLLARVDARILTGKDVRAVRAAVTGVLGRTRLRQLRDIWRQAHAVDDTDADTMIELAWRWCHILGIDPHGQPHPPQPDPGVFAGRLAAALTDYLAASLGVSTAEYTARRITGRHSAPAHWTRRDPTTAEQAAARRLAARLRQARTAHPEPARQPSTLPPGRLRTRAAITAEAQRAAGGIPTAAPWQRRTPLPPDKPTLHLAVLVDVSGSMHSYAKPMSSAGWILAHAAHRNQAVTTTIAFGDQVTLLVPPKQRPTQVLEMTAHDGSEEFTAAVKLADRLLDLRHRRSLRMLAVVSDGQFVDIPIPAAQKLVTTLHRAGCPVLWLQPAGLECHTFADTTTITIADPLEAIEHIAGAAITALANA